jgi:type IX secretion system PorP/SprF family membrane protein
MKKILFTITVTFFLCHTAKAQFDAQLTHYWAAIGYFNPAYAGQYGKLEATALSRIQWLGVKNAPKSTIVTASLPYKLLGKTHGFGGVMYNDRAGLFSVSMFAGQYAFKKKLFKGDFSAGLEIGYINQSFDGSKIEIPEDDYHEQTDEALPTSEVSGKSIDASLGVFFSKKKWFAGLSVAHVLAPKIDLNETNTYEIPRTYYFVNGYNIPLSNPLFELRPVVVVKTMEMSAVYLEDDSTSQIVNVKSNTFKAMLKNTQIDVSARMYYNNLYWGGLTWRNGDAVGLMLGLKFKMIEAGYAYDFPISVIRQSTTGSHEVFLRYSMDLNFNKKSKEKHKSVRFL